LVLAGFRNSYDFDFNKDGEIFTFDSDMEWDWGLPWIAQPGLTTVSSAGIWLAVRHRYLAGILRRQPATDDQHRNRITTGVKFGTKSKFPKKYREALYAFDGRMAVFSPFTSNRKAQPMLRSGKYFSKASR